MIFFGIFTEEIAKGSFAIIDIYENVHSVR